MSHPPILLGTSSFTAAGWDGVFYPRGMRPADYLAFYAEHFHTVEVDSTFYGCPSARTVDNWAARTPAGFIFSVKVPHVITHERVLVDCDADLKQFLDTMNILGPKLSPIVFQFPFFNRAIFRDRHEFLDRLVPFVIKTQCFAVPNPITLRGNLGRNTVIGPGLVNLDFSLFKNNHIKKISDTFNAQFRTEFFNIVNHTNFAPPLDNRNIFDSAGSRIGNADLITSTQTPSRQIQFALKLIW